MLQDHSISDSLHKFSSLKRLSPQLFLYFAKGRGQKIFLHCRRQAVVSVFFNVYHSTLAWLFASKALITISPTRKCLWFWQASCFRFLKIVFMIASEFPKNPPSWKGGAENPRLWLAGTVSKRGQVYANSGVEWVKSGFCSCLMHAANRTPKARLYA